MTFQEKLRPKISKSVRWLLERSSHFKILVVSVVDALLLSAVTLGAYFLRTSAFDLPPRDKLALYALGPLLSIGIGSAFGVYNSAARGHSDRLERSIFITQAVCVVVWMFLLVLFGTEGFARSVVLIYFTLSILAMSFVRRLAKYILVRGLADYNVSAKRVPVLIFGVGNEGQALAQALNSSAHYRPVAFLDTDYTIIDRMVGGLRVYPLEKLASVVERWEPKEIIIAKPHANRAARRKLLEQFSDEGLKVKVAPGIAAVMDGKVNVDDIREINIEDLLGRDPVPPDSDLMREAIENRVLMVTGAGGSIGSELVRQAAGYKPRKIILVENSEFALFEIDREMRSRMQLLGGCEVVPVLETVLDRDKMHTVMKQYGVEIVFHAAAYKHVHLVQQNPEVGIRNNVWGTMACAEAAELAGVGRFILISTDKAVRPTGVMGASKRVAEMCIQALAARSSTSSGPRTIFSMVRFGNVLGSTGSVVPLFKEQIAKGGPLLVTDPEVTRYFMLIPEAAQLVIQAGAMAKGGEVFVLDMGEPVKIVMLAETMIELAGLERRTKENPEGDIEIEFIGLRDGEKAYEELQIGRDVTTTQHDRIMRSNEHMLTYTDLQVELARIKSAIENKGTLRAGDMVLELANRGAAL
jgi:FlaA1/EpsC-like NDP-sugar epimerase